MIRVPRPRITIGAMLVLVAFSALVVTAFRPRTTRIVDVKVGTGPRVKSGDTVDVHYVGRLADGTVFDSSKPRGTPFSFVVGRGMVIRGWDIGLVGMQVGGVRQLTIPWEEAYGERGVPPTIPPRAKLYFDVELARIR